MSNKCKYDKRKCIEAIKWSYGMTVKEAEGFYKEATPEVLEAIVEGYDDNAKSSFYHD